MNPLIGKVLAYTTDISTQNVNNIYDYVNIIIKDWAIPIVGGLAVLMLIYAGYLYMTSQGNPEATGQAKDIIVGVIVGILLLFLIGIILSTIGIQ